MNQLQHQTSPYLKQHQHNPVHWFAWGEEAWNKAKAEDKLVLVSVGYSACHWCHVMERESFEDEATAAIMNEHFVCIKVDREERPDVDQVYMEAVQTIHGSGGWPLNCFTLPDGRPVHGGTYFRNADWKKTLLALKDFYASRKADALDYAEKLTHGLQQFKINLKSEEVFSLEKMDSLILGWQNYFDVSEGGQDREPKFPLPNNYAFLLQFGVLRKNKFILNYLHLTLHKMAWGGIYDQVGGGFARYSVDRYWHVPHFEKMLYDNAQLVSLYSAAFQLTQNAYYQTIIDESITFVLRELTHPEGGFYSALDADSEGVEGKFYTWTREEFAQALAGHDYATENFVMHLANYYSVTDTGNWAEEETNILKCVSGINDYCTPRSLDPQAFAADIIKAKAILLEARSHRTRPGLDDKILTSWNALMIKALAEAFDATGNDLYLREAKKHYAFLKQHVWVKDQLFHTFHYANKKPSIAAFLDDYVFLAEAAMSLYQSTFNDNYLHDSRKLAEEVITLFSDDATGLFYYTGSNNESLFFRKHEVHDNVIPSSNAVLATLLYKLSTYFSEQTFGFVANRMLHTMQAKFASYPSGYSQWLQLQLLEIHGLKTVCITGESPLDIKKQFQSRYRPDIIFAGGENSSLPIMEGKTDSLSGHIHVCTANACLTPVATAEEAIALLG